MKLKLSVTIDESLLEELSKLVKSGKFRNKSHVVEYGLNNLIKKNAKE